MVEDSVGMLYVHLLTQKQAVVTHDTMLISKCVNRATVFNHFSWYHYLNTYDRRRSTQWNNHLRFCK